MRPGRTPRNDLVVVCAKRSVGEPLLAAFEAVSDVVTVHRIRSREGRRGRALARHRLGEAVRAWRASSGRGALVMLNAGSEVLLVALAMRLWPGSGRTRLVVADFLPSPRRRLDRLQGWVLRRVDGWVCIRRGDPAMLARRFGVRPARCSFALWPLSFDPSDPDAIAAETRVESSYVYSAGNAYRDWATLFDALELSPYPTVLSTGAAGSAAIAGRPLPPFTQVVPLLAPAHGRSLAHDAVLVIVPLLDTDLAAGPTVLTDAMALGAPVVAADVNGTRDYVADGVTGRLVPPGDPRALAAVVSELLADDDQRDRLGTAGRRWAHSTLRAEPFVREVLRRCAG